MSDALTSGPARTDPSTRLHVFIARDVRTAVVLRRGPSKQVRMLRWDLATDDVVGGQWLSGRLYEERCDLSPDGELFVYFCGKFNKRVHRVGVLAGHHDLGWRRVLPWASRAGLEHLPA